MPPKPKPTYRVYEIRQGPEPKHGWYYEPADATRGTGPFTTKELAQQAGNLWKVATERAQQNKP